MNPQIIKSTFLLVFFFLAGCAGKSIVAPTTNNAPFGTFGGQFSYYHVNSQTHKKDSLKANIVLTLNKSTGFSITGDTTTVHAGSHGGYIINSSFTNILFLDETYPKSGTPTKTHLNGVYNYTFDGTNLQIAAYGALDTLSLVYVLKRTSN